MKFIVDLVFSILIGGYGLIFLITPYEKLQEKFPKLKLKTPKMAKIVGAILVVVAVLMLLLGI